MPVLDNLHSTKICENPLYMVNFLANCKTSKAPAFVYIVPNGRHRFWLSVKEVNYHSGEVIHSSAKLESESLG